MARYNTFKYGGTDYGATTESFILWKFIPKWGDFWDGNANARLIGMRIERGRDSFLGRVGQGWEYYKPGIARFTLDNSDGTYDPLNTSSPLYPDVKPGGFVRLSAIYPNTEIEYNVFYGQIDDIRPYLRNGRKVVEIVARDALQWCNNHVIRSGIFSAYELDEVGDWIILQAGDWPEDEWQSFPVVTTNEVPYSWFWGKNILQCMRELGDAEIGNVYHSRHGRLRFGPRSEAGFAGTLSISEADILQDIDYPMPWDIVRNRIELEWDNIIVMTTQQTVWTAGQGIPLPNYETVRFEPTFKYAGVPCAINNINLTNLSYNSQPDGSGVGLGSVNVDYNTTISGGVQLAITNSSGFDGYVTEDSYITGVPYYSPGTTVTIAEDTASKAQYGTRTMRIRSKWIQDQATAQDYVDYILYNLKNPQIIPTIKLHNQPTFQLGADLWRVKVSLTSTTLGISEDYRIGKIIHEWLSENGVSWQTTLTLEPLFGDPT